MSAPHNARNIVFILTDDQGPWALGCAGNNEIDTPNLDRLAATGMRFKHFFCTSPVCSPARASLLTGRIPSQHGIHDWLAAGDTTAAYEPARNGELIEYLQGQPGYTDILAQAGYNCGLSGKWHLGDAHHPQKGFSYWAVHAKGGGPYYNAPMIRDGDLYEEPAYVTDVITDNALNWLDTIRNDDAPFYLGVHYTAPHSPWAREHHPVELFDNYYNNCPFDSVPDNLAPPQWAQHLNIPVNDKQTRRVYLSGYYAAVAAMDANVGRILDYLEQHNLRDNTLVVFTSDNGMNMGHHGIFGKGNATFPMNMFEESITVPFIASHPGVIPDNTTADNLVSQYDWFPTLLDYVGIQHATPANLPGRSFVPVLQPQRHRQNECSHHHDHVVVFDEYGPVRMIRSTQWKYVHRYRWGPNELYDLANDPGESTNLAGQTTHQAIEDELRNALFEWFERYADPDRTGHTEAVTGLGQIGKCGRHADIPQPFQKHAVEHLIT